MLSEETVLRLVRCSLCGQTLRAQWQTGATVDDRYVAVDVHHCPTDTVRIIDAAALTDDELVAEAIGRGLMPVPPAGTQVTLSSSAVRHTLPTTAYLAQRATAKARGLAGTAG